MIPSLHQRLIDLFRVAVVVAVFVLFVVVYKRVWDNRWAQAACCREAVEIGCVEADTMQSRGQRREVKGSEGK